MKNYTNNQQFEIDPRTYNHYVDYFRVKGFRIFPSVDHYASDSPEVRYDAFWKTVINILATKNYHLVVNQSETNFEIYFNVYRKKTLVYHHSDIKSLCEVFVLKVLNEK